MNNHSILYCFIFLVVASGLASAQQRRGQANDYQLPSHYEDTLKKYEEEQQAGANGDDAYQRSLDELFVTAEIIDDQQGGDDPVVFEGDFNQPRWLQGLTVTKSDNPMLEDACRQQAVKKVTLQAAEKMHIRGAEQALQATLDHMQQHADFIRNNEISHTDYLRSLAECETYCAPLVASLMQCHILSVARRPHGIVLFDLASTHVEAAYEDGIIAELAEEFSRQEGAQVLVVGRASQIGDLRYNRRLAGQRALAVRDRLVNAGVPLEKIRPIWFGWEPPQIDAFMAAEYGMNDMFQSNGKDLMNQSVVLVLF